jgi:hypothetical protein
MIGQSERKSEQQSNHIYCTLICLLGELGFGVPFLLPALANCVKKTTGPRPFCC